MDQPAEGILGQVALEQSVDVASSESLVDQHEDFAGGGDFCGKLILGS